MRGELVACKRKYAKYFKMNNKYKTTLIISMAVIILDLVIKYHIHSQFELAESITVIPDYFNLTYVRNPGAAFGFLAQSHEIFRKVFFSIIPLVACGLIIQILRKCTSEEKTEIVGLALIMGGALGNYVNRLISGYVIDFLDFHFYFKYHWPAFNLADVAIVTGVGILMLEQVKGKKLSGTRGSEGQAI